MTRAQEPPPRPLVLCAGIAVDDFIFRVDRFPTPSTKSVVEEFAVTGGGCAANAAIAIARLEGRARFTGPLGDDAMSDRIVGGMRATGVEVDGVERVLGGVASLSGIFIDAAGERLLATRREQGLRGARPRDPERLVANAAALLADNHFAEFVQPLCAAARRCRIPIVLDVDRATRPDDPLFALSTHPVFSAEALRATTGIPALEPALARAGEFCRGFVAVTDGANGVLWRENGVVGHMPAFSVATADTLAAGDVFHGAFALALAERSDTTEALRFASAAAALKCTRFGGILGTPTRSQVAELLSSSSTPRVP